MLQGGVVSLVELQGLGKQKGYHYTLLSRLPSTPTSLLLALLQEAHVLRGVSDDLCQHVQLPRTLGADLMW